MRRPVLAKTCSPGTNFTKLFALSLEIYAVIVTVRSYTCSLIRRPIF